ncbi:MULTISPECIES: PA2778 family cysteine peptidase [Halomonas]|uniref:Tetratricopeptide repeat protein n=1 Tax=Halomonas ventosae TaxID=229007 RepID=A0A4R6I3U0_9GAMM|nr:PA2778 family cysteine peptidase [Halomonas ventosae]TDO16663.1 tetratricopeptide repeat protein [Halomonas ventosae]
MLLSMLLLTGCATTPQLSEATRQQVPERVLLEGVPFHAQRDYQCGPASLAMVLQAQGAKVDVDTLIPQVFLPGRQGSVQPEMLATVRRHGHIPFRIAPNFDSLLTEIAAGHPVVVMQNLSLPAWPVWHYAVAIGFDLDEQTLTLHSGMTAKRSVAFSRFDATWARSDRWAFVALPPGALPASLEAEPALQAIADFERVQGAAASLPAWEALVVRYSGSAMGYFALGNARHANGDSEGAEQAFAQAVAQEPEMAVAWLNLGLLHREQGETRQARQALQNAAALPGPWQQPALEALAAL